jgi:F-type H+-transporting ATPase subunit a
MDHHTTWLSFLPGYAQFQEYLRHTQEGAVGHAKGLLFGQETMIIQHVGAAFIVMLVVLFLSLRARADMARAGEGAVIPAPGLSARNFFEVLLETLYKQMGQIIGGAEVKRYFPVIATLALFIFFSNILGLIPGMSAPTSNWNTTFACSIFVFLYYNFHGLRVNGMGHIAHMANPAGVWWGWFLAPLMFPIEIVSHIARPFSLGVRLAANMTGDHAVLSAFLGLMPILLPLPFFFLGLMVCVIQTIVFSLLSIVYIGLAVQEAHHGDEHHEEHGAAHPAHAHA